MNMGFFRRNKDERIEEITAWGKAYLEERRSRASAPERGTGAAEAPPAREEVTEEPSRKVTEPVTPRDEPMQTVREAPDRTASEVSPERESGILAVREEEIATGDMEEVPPETTLFQRLRSGLSRTRDGLVGRIDRLFSVREEIDRDVLEDLEEILIESDIGVQQSLSLIQNLQEELEGRDLKDPAKIRRQIQKAITDILSGNGYALNRPDHGPYVIMVVGVNGVGKTTTIGKLAWRYVQAGEEVLLAAGDTFRAAAAEQLGIWAGRAGAGLVKHKSGADPSAVVFDALKAAVSRGTSVVIADTAGRLHTKVNLMEELKKMKRVMEKVIPGAPHEVLLVLDATTGQNALSQARTFHEAIGVTGIVLTKLDGTAKGGIVTAIVGELGLPVKLIGIGEGMEDLRDFHPDEFVHALFGE